MKTQTSPIDPKHKLSISVFSNVDELGKAAALKSAEIINEAIAKRGHSRLLLATGNSQIAMMSHLVRMDVDWGRVDVFHLDEYVGIDAGHPASFRRWIRTRFTEKTHPRSATYLVGDAPDPDAEALRYAQLLAEGPVDIAYVGFGENGHIAFNDPHVADFSDPLLVKRVALDATCRMQQVGEGHFPDLDSVPREAISVSCTGLFRAENWICCVPEARKADAVKNALEGPITTTCPASLAKVHPRAHIYLDTESAGRLEAMTFSAGI